MQTQLNGRLQPCAIRAGAAVLPLGTSCPPDLSGFAGGLLHLVLGYGNTGSNGNLRSESIASASGVSLSQGFTYDPLNRLKMATEGSSE